LAKPEKAAAKLKATDADRRAACAAKAALQPALDQIAALDATLAPYEKIKTDLGAARARFRGLTDAFVSELKNRCGFMGDDKKRTLVIELFAQDVEVGLDVAVKEQRQHLGRFIEQLWDKYAVPLQNLSDMKTKVTSILNDMMVELGYR
jgi:type I restriction enzyme M protein